MSPTAMTDASIGDELVALLGRGTTFVGKLWFDAPVRIEGSFEGEIRSRSTLVIGDGAEVRADILVDTLIVKGGTVTGSIRARQSIELYLPARLVGNLRAPNIFIDRGVKVEGTCAMGPVDEEPIPVSESTEPHHTTTSVDDEAAESRS